MALFFSKIRWFTNTFNQSIKFITQQGILLRGLVVFVAVFLFLSALQPAQLTGQLRHTPAQIYASLAFIASLVHVVIWLIAGIFYAHSLLRWNVAKSLLLKCFIAVAILSCMYLYVRWLGMAQANLAFFFKWGLIMSPSFAVAMLLYEMRLRPPTPPAAPLLSPDFKLATTAHFTFAMTAKKATSLGLTNTTLSNGIFLYFDNHAPLFYNTTLSQFLVANAAFGQLVRCADSYVVNLDKVTRLDQAQGLLYVAQTQISVSKKGGNGIVGLEALAQQIAFDGCKR